MTRVAGEGIELGVVDQADTIEVAQEGRLWWAWTFWGVSDRAEQRGSMVHMPGFYMELRRGSAFTRWGAHRRARRAARRYRRWRQSRETVSV